MSRTYASRTPGVVSAVNTGYGGVAVFGDYGDLQVSFDVSNCGVVNIHYPKIHSEQARDWAVLFAVTQGFGAGFPIADKAAIQRESGATIYVDSYGVDSTIASMKNMLRISYPVHSTEPHGTEVFAKAIEKLLGKRAISYSKPVYNCNSGNEIVSATINIDPYSYSAAVLKRINAMLKRNNIDYLMVV